MKLAVLIPIHNENEKLLKQNKLVFDNLEYPPDTKVFRLYGKGKGHSINEAVRKYKPEFIAVFDVDAIPEKDFLAKGLKAIDGYAALQGERYPYNPDDNWLTKIQEEEYEKALNEGYLQGSGMIIRVKDLEDVGYFGDSITEDRELSLKFKAVNKRIGTFDSRYYEEVPSSLYQYVGQRIRWTTTIFTLHKSGRDTLARHVRCLKINLITLFVYFIAGFRAYFNLNGWFHTKKRGKEDLEGFLKKIWIS